MASLLRISLAPVGRTISAQHFSTATILNNDSYRFLVAGGGAGGLAIASSLARKYGDGNVAVIEPSEVSLLAFYAARRNVWNGCVFYKIFVVHKELL